MPISEASARVAETDLNEPAGEARAAVLASFTASVTEKIGEAAASRFDWALLACLRQSKWDTTKALEKVCKLSAFAVKNEQYFEGLSPDEFIGQAAIGMTSHLPTRTSNGELVLLINGQKLKDYARSYTMRDMLRYSVFYLMLLLRDEETQVNGCIILENLKVRPLPFATRRLRSCPVMMPHSCRCPFQDYPIFALNTMKGMGPTGMKASFDWLGAAPLRLRGLFACHQPWYVGMMLALVKPFMPKKLRERTHLYGNDTAAMLAAAGLQPEHVPRDYGGTLDDFDPGWYLKAQMPSSTSGTA